jgi:DNA-binding NtrC family response regulator
VATVLVIDDELSVARVVARVLARDGIDTIAARSVADATALLEDASVRVLVCDVNLDDGTINDVLAAMETRGLSLPVVAISGRASEITLRDPIARRLIVDVIQKPFDIEALREAVRAAFSRSTDRALPT